MKISWNWLGRHVDLSGLDPLEVGRLFTLKVAELDGIHPRGHGLDGVRVVRVDAVEKHTDKLSRVRIFDGEQHHDLVCGAPNAPSALGRCAAWVPPGTTLPDGKRIELAVVRGVESAGMLASKAELGLSDDHDGIWILDGVSPGPLYAVAEGLRDTVFEVDNKAITHRPDLWGHRGIAREVGCLVRRPLLPLEQQHDFGGDGPDPVVTVEDHGLCPRYVCAVFDGVRVQRSPLWLETLLEAVGQRPRSNVVDLTNFVMLDVGNPIHAFDAAQISGGHVYVRRANDGEVLRTLDGAERRCTVDTLLIADSQRGLAIAGVMGGENSEIGAETTRVLLEAANFDADSVRKTSSRLGLRTDASARFEKALDPALAEDAARLFAALLLRVVPGAHTASRLVDRYPHRAETHVITLDPRRVSDRLGLDVPLTTITDTLERLGCTLATSPEGPLAVTVPSWRATRDVRIAEDLIEEVGRMIGYAEIPPVAPLVAVSAPELPTDKLQERRVRRFLTLGAGMAETLSYAFDWRPMLERLDAPTDGRVLMQLPISADLDGLRRDLVPNLLHQAEKNARQTETIRLYEIGRVFHPRAGDLPAQPRRVGFVISEPSDDPVEAWRTLRGAVDGLLDALHAAPATWEPLEGEDPARPWLHPTRGSRLRLGDAVIGTATLLHPRAARALELRRPTATAELDLDVLLALGEATLKHTPLPRFPAVPYDLAFEVARTVPTGAVADAIRAGAAAAPLRHVAWLSSFVLDDERRSDAYHLVFRSDERSLTTDEVNGYAAAVVAHVQQSLGATLRG